MSCGAVCRRGSNPTLLGLWCRLAAVSLIQPLAWGPPYAVGAALKKKKKAKGRLFYRYLIYRQLKTINGSIAFSCTRWQCFSANPTRFTGFLISSPTSPRRCPSSPSRFPDSGSQIRSSRSFYLLRKDGPLRLVTQLEPRTGRG